MLDPTLLNITTGPHNMITVSAEGCQECLLHFLSATCGTGYPTFPFNLVSSSASPFPASLHPALASLPVLATVVPSVPPQPTPTPALPVAADTLDDARKLVQWMALTDKFNETCMWKHKWQYDMDYIPLSACPTGCISQHTCC